MRKKVIDFVCGSIMFWLGVGFIGPIGGYEVGAITGGECVVRSGLCLVGLLALVALNSALMERCERGLMR